MNTSISTESTQYSPYFLLFGRECRTPIDTNLIPVENIGSNAKDYVETVHKQLRIAREIALRNIEDAQEKYKLQHDKRAQEPTFKIGDKVWIDNKRKTVGLTPKLCNKWLGPCYIVDDCENNSYRVRRCTDNIELKSPIHADRMKLFHDPEIRPTNRADPPENQSQGDTANDTANDNENIDVTDDANDVNDNADDNSNVNDSQTQYFVEKILRDRKLRGKREFRIKWQNFPSSENTWEPEEGIPEHIIQNYFAQKSNRKRRRRRH